MATAIAGTEAQCVETLEAVAELYASHAVRVRRIVHLRLTAPDPIVEDACQVAWMRLVRNRTRVHRQTAAAWVVRVASREALRQMARTAWEEPLDAYHDDVAELAPDLIQALAEGHARIGSIDYLPERQRRLIWLHGLGFSYAEIVELTGESRRTIERQLSRARHRLRDAA